MPVYVPDILLSIPRDPVLAVGLPLTLGYFSGPGSTKSTSNLKWFHELRAPRGRPSPKVFPIVWTVHYLCMGYSSHIAVRALDSCVHEADRKALSLGIALYYVQLSLNYLWRPLFFQKRQIGLALVVSILVAGTTWHTAKLFYKHGSRQGAYFMLPYCVWLGFAMYLNAATWWLNRSKSRD